MAEGGEKSGPIRLLFDNDRDLVSRPLKGTLGLYRGFVRLYKGYIRRLLQG